MKNQKIRSMKVHEQSGYNYKAKQWERLRIAKQRRSLETACTMFSTNFGP